jgi:hypothetical protein
MRSINSQMRSSWRQTDRSAALGGVLIEEKSWLIRYLVIRAGDWLYERDVFISPAAVRQLPGQGSGGNTIELALAREDCTAAPSANLNLCSSAEVGGYDIQVCDSSIGRVEDFLFDDADWVTHSLVVNTYNWWLGSKEILIATSSIDRIDGDKCTVRTTLTRTQFADSPAYQPSIDSRTACFD